MAFLILLSPDRSKGVVKALRLLWVKLDLPEMLSEKILLALYRFLTELQSR